MKRIKDNLIKVGLILFLSMAFVACNQESLNPVSNDLDFEAEALLSETDLDNSLALMLEEPEITDATETVEFDILNDGVPEALDAIDFPQIEGLLVDSLSRKDSLKFRCKRMWDSIALTDTQKLRLQAVRSKFLNCKKASLTSLRVLHKSYIQKAKVEKMKLLKAYKNGDITQTELKRKLVQLNTRMRTAIKNDQRRQNLVQQLRTCHKNYLTSVKTILTPAQWKAFIKCRRLLYRGL